MAKQLSNSTKKKGVKYGLRGQKDIHPNQWTGTPEQEKFILLYITPGSTTFGNAYQSAMEAGFSESYSRILAAPSVNRLWVKEATDILHLGKEHIQQGIQQIAIDRDVKDSDKLRAYELLAKLQGLFVEKKITAHVNIEEALRDLE